VEVLSVLLQRHGHARHFDKILLAFPYFMFLRSHNLKFQER